MRFSEASVAGVSGSLGCSVASVVPFELRRRVSFDSFQLAALGGGLPRMEWLCFASGGGVTALLDSSRFSMMDKPKPQLSFLAPRSISPFAVAELGCR
jgi:hypothetical protein